MPRDLPESAEELLREMLGDATRSGRAIYVRFIGPPMLLSPPEDVSADDIDALVACGFARQNGRWIEPSQAAREWALEFCGAGDGLTSRRP